MLINYVANLNKWNHALDFSLILFKNEKTEHNKTFFIYTIDEI